MIKDTIGGIFLGLCIASPVFAQQKPKPASSPAQTSTQTPAPQAPAGTPSPSAAGAAKTVPAAANGTAKSGTMASESEQKGEQMEPGLIPHMAPFKENWEAATPDEKSIFLEIYGETRKVLQERWDKSTPEERQAALKSHPLLSARPLKHHWISATPEERAAYLEAHPKTGEKIKTGWDGATADQRTTLAREHPYLARRAFFHNWSYATPQEKIAYLDAHPALRAQLKSRWVNATAAQKDWYEQNYAGLMDVLAHGKSWADTTVPERAAFLDANPGIDEKLREDWQKSPPEKRAQLVRNWAGWPLRDITTKVDKPEKAERTHSDSPTHAKGKYKNTGPKI